MAYHVAELHFWVAMADSENRYWNALGLGNPFAGDTNIIAEVNPPKSGIDRNIAGLFVEDPAGEICIAHRGKVGGGRKGIGKEAFLDWYKEPLSLIFDVDRHGLAIVLGRLNHESLIRRLATFTRLVAAFKNEAVATQSR